MTHQPINGKVYPMWQGIVAAKDHYIGGRVIERDRDTRDSDDIITNLRMEPCGDDSAMFCIDTDKGDARSLNVAYGGITARDGVLYVHGYSLSWELHPKQTPEN